DGEVALNLHVLELAEKVKHLQGYLPVYFVVALHFFFGAVKAEGVIVEYLYPAAGAFYKGNVLSGIWAHHHRHEIAYRVGPVIYFLGKDHYWLQIVAVFHLIVDSSTFFDFIHNKSSPLQGFYGVYADRAVVDSP